MWICGNGEGGGVNRWKCGEWRCEQVEVWEWRCEQVEVGSSFMHYRMALLDLKDFVSPPLPVSSSFAFHSSFSADQQ